MKITLLACSILALPAIGWADQTVHFNRDVRPILSDRCFQCHGPNENDREADLRLDRAEGADGAYRTVDQRPAIQPGSPAASEVWRRITAHDDDRMPPPDSAKPPLTRSEQEILRQWIEQGAPYTQFWAFVPPRRPEPPIVEDLRWNRRPIDRFVRRSIEEAGLLPHPPADRRTLIRRLSLDLTGLPPSRAEIHSFLQDQSPHAYERLVDRLLAEPQYGEHMTRYWLDLVRFADTNGIHHDHLRDMTPYRDWVVRSFNENLPYDQFVKDQLAGDVYPQPTRDQLIASGFNRLHLIIDRGTALPEESFTRNVIDRVTAVSTAFMGLTVQCAVCHDHKYDPITMRDFYQLFAFFNNLDGDPETGGRSGADFRRGLQPPYISLANAVQQTRLDELQRQVKRRQSEVRKLQQQLRHVNDDPEKARLAKALEQAKLAVQEARKDREAFEVTVPGAMVMKERAEMRPAFILVRGEYDNPGDRVDRDAPAFLPPLKKQREAATRLDLAEWFVAPEHPLTARVAVNRFWQQLFGVGIVKTSEDLGAQGDWPSHPDLLDHLAVSFIESEWNVKGLIKQMVMSETYRQDSAATPQEFAADPENRLLARGARFRLDAEVIRDLVLATSGLLNDELYGKSVKPPQPKGLWKAVSMPSSYPHLYEPDTGNAIYRRSVYTFWKRGLPPPQMTILNAPSREACIARRERTNTPLQALLLMNEPEYMKAAQNLARMTLTERTLQPHERLAVIYETITSRVPDAVESRDLLQLVGELQTIYSNRNGLAKELAEGTISPGDVPLDELAAWTMLVNAIYNLDIAKTRD